MKRIKVKVCCISSLEEACLAIEYGADALGLVGPMPSGGPGIIDDNLDLCSGLRTNGKLDEKKLRDFMSNVSRS